MSKTLFYFLIIFITSALALGYIWGNSYLDKLENAKASEYKHWSNVQMTPPTPAETRSMIEHGEDTQPMNLEDYKIEGCEDKSHMSTFVPAADIKELVTWLLGALNGIVLLLAGVKRLFIGKVIV